MSEVYFKDVSALKGPILSLLKDQGYQAVDMHYHSAYSVDGLATVKQILQKCKKDGVGTSFTDHNHIQGALKAVKLGKKMGVFVIPGMELTCHNGVHILVHFADTREYKRFFEREIKHRLRENPWFLDIDHNQIVDLASKYKCLITTPHPYGPGLCGVMKFGITKKTLAKIHAVEVLNGCGVGSMNPKAISWAKRVKKGITGGSDGHCLAEHGTSLTLCKARTPAQFLDQIKKRKSIVIGKEEKLLEDGVHAVEKFIREEKKAPHKQLEKMWRDRGILEWKSFMSSIKKGLFHHFHAHHQKPKLSKISSHKHTKHLKKYVGKKK